MKKMLKGYKKPERGSRLPVPSIILLLLLYIFLLIYGFTICFFDCIGEGDTFVFLRRVQKILKWLDEDYTSC